MIDFVDKREKMKTFADFYRKQLALVLMFSVFTCIVHPFQLLPDILLFKG